MNLGWINKTNGVDDINAEDFNRVFQEIESAGTDLENNKVNKERGKGLSSNDFTDAHKEKLENIEDDLVTSVNGKTGDVNLTAEDIGALPSDTEIPSIEGLASEEYVDAKAIETLTEAKTYTDKVEESKADKDAVYLKEETDQRISDATDNKADILELSTYISKNITITDSSNSKLVALNIYGDSVQNGTPAPNAPIEIASVENPTITITDENNENVQSVAIPYVLRSIKDVDGVLKAQDEIVVDGKNKIVKHIKRVEHKLLTDSNVTWIMPENASSHFVITSGVSLKPGYPNALLCSHYPVDVGHGSVATMSDKTVSYANSFYGGLTFYDTTYTTLAEWKAHLAEKPIELVGVRGTVVETDISDTEAGQALLTIHTNYPNTTVICDADCKLTYGADTTIAYNNLKNEPGSAGGGSEWTYIGETVLQGSKLPLQSYADGIFTFDTSNPNYPPPSGPAKIIKNDYSSAYFGYFFKTDIEGQYSFKNLDNQEYKPSITAADYFVDKPSAGSLQISNISGYTNFKGRITSPIFLSHGARESYLLSVDGYSIPYSTRLYTLSGYKIITTFEIINSGLDGYKMVQYNAFNNKESNKVYANLIKIPTQLNGKATLSHNNSLLVSGTTLEIWGKK